MLEAGVNMSSGQVGQEREKPRGDGRAGILRRSGRG